MAISLKHFFASAKADGPDTTQVQPSHWNSEHVLQSASGVLLGRATAGTGNVEEITNLGSVGVFQKARAGLVAAQNASTSWAKVLLDTVTYDTDSIWDSTNKRFVPTKAGYYLCTARARTATVGQLAMAVAKNGTLMAAVGADIQTNTFGTGGTLMVQCDGATDYLEMYAISSSVRAFTANQFDTYMEVLGPF